MSNVAFAIGVSCPCIGKLEEFCHYMSELNKTKLKS